MVIEVRVGRVDEANPSDSIINTENCGPAFLGWTTGRRKNYQAILARLGVDRECAYAFDADLG